MPQKKLQEKSIYAEYDEDGDGIVSDDELSHVKEIKKTETSIIIERKIDVCVGGTIVTLFVVIKRQ